MGSVPDGLITRESRETVLSHLEPNEPLETLESHDRQRKKPLKHDNFLEELRYFQGDDLLNDLQENIAVNGRVVLAEKRKHGRKQFH